MSDDIDFTGMTMLEQGKVFSAYRVREKCTWEKAAAHFKLNVNRVRGYGCQYRRSLTQETRKRQLRDENQMPRQDLEIMFAQTIEDLEAEGIPPDELLDADIEELIDIAQRLQQVYEQTDPVITHRAIQIDTTQPIAVLLAGCFQIGGRYTWHQYIADKLDAMFTLPNAYIATFGDEIENFKSGSFAGARSVFSQVLPPPLQRRLWGYWFDKYASRILWGTGSQHGTTWNERQDNNPIKERYVEAGVPFFDGMHYVTLRVGKERYFVAGAHEFPGQSMYNKLHGHKRALWQRFPNADVLVMADKHSYAIAEEAVYTNEWIAGNRQSPFIWMVQVGTAKSGPEPYTMRGWERGFSEWPWMVLWPNEHKIKVTRHLDDVWMWTMDSKAAAASSAIQLADAA